MADFLVNGNLVFTTGDNISDIGKEEVGGAFKRPRDGYFGTSVRVGNAPTGVHSVFTGAGIQVTVGGATLVGANVTTDATRKTTRLATAHYTNATAPFLWVRAVSDNGANTLQLGGGDGAFTPASAVAIFTSATPGTAGIGTQRWHWNSAGNLLASTDNANDLGASGATRPRTGYFGTSVVVGADPGGTDALRVAGKLRSSDVWIMTGSPASAGAGTRYVGGSGASNLKFNVASGGAHVFSVNDVEKARIDDDFTVPAGVKWKSSTGHNVMYASGSEDIHILRHFGTRPSTLLQIWAPSGALTPREATLALVRGDEPNQEYLDLYNNGYPSASPPSVKYGIRLQKRGSGEWRDFHFERDDGAMADEEPIFILRASDPTVGNVSAEFYGLWIRLPQRTVDPTPPANAAGAMWYRSDTNPPQIRYWTGAAVRILTSTAA
jgi:hypothetical protein